MWIDTHVHLCDSRFNLDRSEVIQRAIASGVQTLVEVADGPDDWERVIQLSQKYSVNILFTLGFHPHYAQTFSSTHLDHLKNLVEQHVPLAIGEIGLDYAKSPAEPRLQRQVFIRWIEIALELQKPVLIHCRQAYEDLLAILWEHYPKPPGTGTFHGVLHCFSGKADAAQKATEMGFALGVDGPVTYPQNHALREAFRCVGPDHLVLETDSPYLPPQSRRGKRNEPSSIPEIAKTLAQILDSTIQEVSQKTMQNTRQLFQIQ